jgi:uncharacterized membrane protein HdeD (DUF308 family)
METIRDMSASWWVVTLRGVVLALIGIAFLAWPGKSLMIITLLLGLMILLDGVLAAISGIISIGKDKHWWVTLIQGGLGIAIGLAILSWPGITLQLIFFLVAIWIIINGILFMVFAIASRKEHYGNWNLTVLGIVALVFGLVIMANPVESVQILMILVGIYAIISGIMNIALGLDLKKVHSDAKVLTS